MSWLYPEEIPKNEIRAWALDLIYRLDAGMFEIEKEYEKKKIKKQLHKDVYYNNYWGKFHAVLGLLSTFDIKISVGTRIAERVKFHSYRNLVDKRIQMKCPK